MPLLGLKVLHGLNCKIWLLNILIVYLYWLFAISPSLCYYLDMALKEVPLLHTSTPVKDSYDQGKQNFVSEYFPMTMQYIYSK